MTIKKAFNLARDCFEDSSIGVAESLGSKAKVQVRVLERGTKEQLNHGKNTALNAGTPSE